MHRSKIEWVLNPDNKTLGWVWNPITGCFNGCEYCYARRLANGRLKSRYLANENLTPCGHGSQGSKCITSDDKTDPFYPRFWEERLRDPLLMRRVRSAGIFVCDMGELFGDWIPKEWQDRVFEVIERCPNHRFYLLTKQPQNLIKFSPFSEHCFVGSSTTTIEQYRAALVGLAVIKAKVKFISFEPLLEHIPIQPPYALEGTDWVIIGAQTKPYKPPKIEWVEEIVWAADEAKIPVFLKNNLWDLLYTNAFDNDIFWANEKATLRQEMPVGEKCQSNRVASVSQK